MPAMHRILTENSRSQRSTPRWMSFTLKTRQLFSFYERNNHRLFEICGRGKLEQGNHIIIVMSLFSKSSVFKIFSVHTKTKSWRVQIPQVWRAFLKVPFGWVWTVGLNGKTVPFSNSLCEVWDEKPIVILIAWLGINVEVKCTPFLVLSLWIQGKERDFTM